MLHFVTSVLGQRTLCVKTAVCLHNFSNVQIFYNKMYTARAQGRKIHRVYFNCDTDGLFHRSVGL